MILYQIWVLYIDIYILLPHYSFHHIFSLEFHFQSFPFIAFPLAVALFLASRAAFLSLKIPPVRNKGKGDSSKLLLLMLLKCQTTNFSSLSLCKSPISQHHLLLDLFSLNVPPSSPTLTLIKLTNSSSLFTKKVETPTFAELPKWVSFGKIRIKTENCTSLYPRES